MNYVPDTIVFVALLICAIVEARAMRNWASWPFWGVVVFRRRETNALKLLQGLRLDRLVTEDEDLKNIGLGIKEVAPGLYLVQFLPKPRRWWSGTEGFESPVTGRIRIDYIKGDIEFTGRFTTVLTALFSFFFLNMVLSIALARHGIDLVFALLFIPATFLIWLQVQYRRHLQDFWFLLVAKLHERK